MTDDRRDFCFPVKRYGWCMLVAWQGWVVRLGYIVALLVGVNELRLSRQPSLLAYPVMIAAALIAICWIEGAQPRWRWGECDDGS